MRQLVVVILRDAVEVQHFDGAAFDSQRRMVERQQCNPDGTWTLSEHTSGRIVVLEHEVPLDEFYDGVALAVGP